MTLCPILGFETHHEKYGVNRSQCPVKLVLLLSQTALDICSSLTSSDRKNYDEVKAALFRHFHYTLHYYFTLHYFTLHYITKKIVVM